MHIAATMFSMPLIINITFNIFEKEYVSVSAELNKPKRTVSS